MGILAQVEDLDSSVSTARALTRSAWSQSHRAPPATFHRVGCAVPRCRRRAQRRLGRRCR